jgi:hypothetical protein
LFSIAQWPRDSSTSVPALPRWRRGLLTTQATLPPTWRVRLTRATWAAPGQSKMRDHLGADRAYLVAADARLLLRQERARRESQGVKRVCIPNRSTKSVERRREQKKRWFRNGQRWT